jgi:hypothetical protein
MRTAVTIQLPEDLECQPMERAAGRDLSLEEVVLESLRQVAQPIAQVEADPIMPLLGTLAIDAETSDVAEHHDAYLGAGLQIDHGSPL